MTEEHKILIPTDHRKEFLEDAEYALKLDNGTITRVLNELETKKDSVSLSLLANQAKAYVEDVQTLLEVVLYLNHQMSIHGFTTEEIITEFTREGIGHKGLHTILEGINKLDNNTKDALEPLFWTMAALEENLHFKSAEAQNEYLRITGEKGKYLGLAPAVRLRLTLEDSDRKPQKVEMMTSLTSLGLLIRRLIEIYAIAMTKAQELKKETTVVCLPREI